MTVAGSTVVQRAQVALQDTSGIRWPATELVTYLNDGQRVLLAARPDQNATVVAVTTVAGARQTLPDTAMSLIEVNGNTSGRAMRRVDMGVLDATDRDWASGAQASTFTNYCYDLRDPRVFWVYPPSTASNGSVDLVVCAYPTDMTASGALYSTVAGNISLPDVWGSALVNYVLYRAYSKDVEFGGNATVAAAYLQAFEAMVGVQATSASAVTPKN